MSYKHKMVRIFSLIYFLSVLGGIEAGISKANECLETTSASSQILVRNDSVRFLFEFDSAELQKDEDAKRYDLAMALKRLQDESSVLEVEYTGHADQIGKDKKSKTNPGKKYNDVLSEDRANSIEKDIRGKIAQKETEGAKKIEIVGVGDIAPLPGLVYDRKKYLTNRNAEIQRLSQNRRVEVRVKYIAILNLLNTD